MKDSLNNSYNSNISSNMSSNSSSQISSHISRRSLLRTATSLGLATAMLPLLGCSQSDKELNEATKTKVETKKDVPQVTLRVNPKNGDKISLLGYGCMRYPMLPGAQSPRGTEIDEKEAFRLVDYAIDHGVNFFDTAYHYHSGASEIMTGKALKRHPRHKFFLETKMPSYSIKTLAEAKPIFEEQLKKCQVEYFDYYLLHTINTVEGYQNLYEKEGVLDYLLEQKQQGRIRNLGWSFHGTSPALEYLLSRPVEWDICMLMLNYHDLIHGIESPKSRRLLAEPAPARWMFEQVCKANIPIVVMEPLMGGRLAQLNRKSLAPLKALRPDVSAASWAFRYAGGLQNVLTLLSGMPKMEHLQDNLATLSPHESLNSEEMAALTLSLSLFISQESIRCTTCGYCMPCPYAVDIPAVFAHFNGAIDNEYLPKDSKASNHAEIRKAFLQSLDKTIPELSQAQRCTNCQKCVPLCPQKINIPDEMLRLAKITENLRREILL